MERFRLRPQNPSRLQPTWQAETDLLPSTAYRYAASLMIISGLLHWLVSQSIFVADINVNDRAGHLDPTLSVSTCGYSIFGMVFTLTAGALLLAVPIGLGLRQYRPGMPLVGTCSVAIAAACHAQEKEQDDMASLPLQWGAVPDAGIPETGVGHCCFSSKEVEMPKEGSAYAGMHKPSRASIREGAGDEHKVPLTTLPLPYDVTIWLVYGFKRS